jgi:hypothetical protein
MAGMAVETEAEEVQQTFINVHYFYVERKQYYVRLNFEHSVRITAALKNF